MSPEAGAARARSLTLVQATAILLAFWAALCLPWFLGGLTIPWDAKNHFYPQLRFLAAALHEGQSPSWAPHVFGGHPQLADPQSLIFSPHMLALALLDAAPSFARMDAAVLAALLMGGIGVLLVFRRRGWRLEGGLAAALVFAFGGSAATRLQHVGMILSYAMLPLALWLLMRVLERRSWLDALAFAAAAAVMAAGRDQIAFLGCVTLAGYAIYAAWAEPRPLAFAASRAPVLLLAAAVAAALLAAPVLLTADFAAMSNRPSVGYDEAARGSLTPWSFLTLLVPDFFGTLGTTEGYWGPGALAWGVYDNHTDRAINYLYLGAIPTLLCLWHGVAGGRLGAREIRFFVVLLAAASVYALGRNTPLFALLFDLPGVSLYRRPADATFLIGFALAVAIGYLLHRLVDEGPPRIPRSRALAVGAGVAAILAAGFVLAEERGQLDTAARAAPWAALFAALGAALIGAAARWRARPAAVGLAIALVLAFDLARHNAGTPVNARSPAEYADLDAEANPLARDLAARLEADHARGERPRVEIIGLGGPWQNAPLVFGLEATLGYNPLRAADYERATGAGEGSHLPRRNFPPLFPGYRSRLADLLGLRYIASGVPLESIDPRASPADFPLLARIGRAYVYENPRALPRARFVGDIVVADRSRLVAGGEWPVDDPMHATVLERRPPEWRKTVALAASRAASAVAIERYRNDEVVVAVRASRPGMLVLHDLHHPAWRATLDGAPAEVYRADVLFRAVYVPEGWHTVRFTYEPLGELMRRLRARLR